MKQSSFEVGDIVHWRSRSVPSKTAGLVRHIRNPNSSSAKWKPHTFVAKYYPEHRLTGAVSQKWPKDAVLVEIVNKGNGKARLHLTTLDRLSYDEDYVIQCQTEAYERGRMDYHSGCEDYKSPYGSDELQLDEHWGDGFDDARDDAEQAA